MAYGYRSERGVLEPAIELVPLVRRIFRDARDGYTPGWIARRLNRDGIPPPRGGANGWSEAGVRLILRNPAYCGERHNIKRAHPAIVSKRAWNEAQAALNARARGKSD